MRWLHDLNKEELWLGWLFACCWSQFFGLWWILICPASAILWAMGGAPGRSAGWRRLGCPALVSGALWLKFGVHWLLISFICQCIVFSFGYGIPSTQPKDEGSRLGRFFWFVFMHSNLSMRQTELATDLAVRGVIALLLAASLWPLYFLNPLWYSIGGLLLIILTSLMIYTWRKFFC